MKVNFRPMIHDIMTHAPGRKQTPVEATKIGTSLFVHETLDLLDKWTISHSIGYAFTTDMPTEHSAIRAAKRINSVWDWSKLRRKPKLPLSTQSKRLRLKVIAIIKEEKMR
jgi:hypothetical protein